jgi:hypothetical protein
MKEIVLNKIACKHCGDILVSHSTHDFMWCKCGAVAVDGGRDYLRRVGNRENYTELSLDSTAPFEKIREVYTRGSYGKNGDEPLKWIPLCEMTDEHLNACIDYNVNSVSTFSFANFIYLRELDYRKENNLHIYEKKEEPKKTYDAVDTQKNAAKSKKVKKVVQQEKQTTAIQQLIEIYKGRKKNVSFRHTFNFIDAVLADLEMQLPKERQQMIDFADSYGFDVCGYDYERAEQYFKETFES